MSYTPGQAEAVTTKAPVVAVLAGAGSGKTHALAGRVRRLIEDGAAANRILVCTFTTAAAAELGERIAMRSQPVMGTLHSWCGRILRTVPRLAGYSEGFSIYDQNDAEAILADVAKDLGMAKRCDPVRHEYARRLRASNALDFDSLIALAHTVLTKHRDDPRLAPFLGYEHVVVDEAQDLDPQQWELLRALKAPNMYAVGDLRQSLYRFRGAAPEVFQRYAAGAHRVSMPDNFRSGGAVVDVANGVASAHEPMVARRNLPGQVTEIVGDPEPETIAHTLAEVIEDGTPPTDIAVLTRTWREAIEIRMALASAGIPSSYYGDNLDPWSSEGGLVLSWYLRLLHNPYDDNLAALVAKAIVDTNVATFRAQAAEERRTLREVLEHAGVLPDPLTDGEETVAHAWHLQSHALDRGRDWGKRMDWCLQTLLEGQRRTLKGFSAWWVFSRSARDKMEFSAKTGGVHLMTVHASKGLEWPTVVVANARTGVYPHYRAKTSEDEEDDRRVLYVAITRARDHLILSRPATIQARGGQEYPARTSRWLTIAQGGA